MKLMDMSCPNCTARLKITDINADYVTCEYCDSRIHLEKQTLKMQYPGAEKRKEFTKNTTGTELAEKTGSEYNDEREIPIERFGPDQVIVETRHEKNKKQILAASCVVLLVLSAITHNTFFTLIFAICAVACIIYLPKKTPEDLRRMDEFAYKTVPISRKNRWVAFLLCLFLGVLGVHNFYVGKIWKGIVYLCTGGVFGIGVIVDLLKLLTGKFRDSRGALLI